MIPYQIADASSATSQAPGPEDLIQLASDIVKEADKSGLLVRLFGGVAIYARCPSIKTHPTLQRKYTDLDFLASVSHWDQLAQIFVANGMVVKEKKPSQITFVKNAILADLRPPVYREDFAFDFTGRLGVAPLTMPIADLLLRKLARRVFKDKDARDACALLLDHRVTTGGDEQEEINREYLYHTTNRNYALWKTVFDNTVMLEKTFDSYLEPEEAQLTWRRIELIQEVLDGKSHTPNWWLGRFFTR